VCTVPRILGVLAGLVVAAGLLATGPADAVERRDDPTLLGAPAIGSCFDITNAQTTGFSLDEATVDCATSHTSEVFAIDTMPIPLQWPDLLGDPDNLMADSCRAAFLRDLGGTLPQRYRAQYGVVIFAPPAEEQRAGARWFACHVIVVNTNGLGPLPHPLPPIGDDLPDPVATCLTQAGAFTTCADSHTWRSSYARLVAGAPTKRNAAQAAKRICPRRVTTRGWYFTFDDVPGPRFLLGCYSRTRR
jgi:putative regulator of septum formation